MTLTDLQNCAGFSPNARFGSPKFRNLERRSVASYERELSAHMDVEFQLRAALARDAALLRQKDTLIMQQELLSKESDHRLLNGLQMIVSMLSLQSRIPGTGLPRRPSIIAVSPITKISGWPGVVRSGSTLTRLA